VTNIELARFEGVRIRRKDIACFTTDFHAPELESDEEYVSNVDMYSAGQTLMEFAADCNWSGMFVINSMPFAMDKNMITCRPESTSGQADAPRAKTDIIRPPTL